ncbi:hypothetical protein B0H67DRAFT_241160 [Lasiosphaeris hirsuta]|uniref:Uncharacterized protein n=1 Tax=Lasiosphaeris hirsuta TaxID=260670 RepID=A0AA40AGN7_9PEZI|nr:hypothetical protein B0H67DRAFT_241160 [Lasiosphaeris hirsuta]
MMWFILQFVFLYIIYLPSVMACNLVVITARNKPEIAGRNDVLFWIFVVTTVLGNHHLAVNNLHVPGLVIFTLYLFSIPSSSVSDNTYTPSISLASFLLRF